ncbi:MAG: DUF4340 domain-containing protein [Planctomycetes bacterium]|nr:DUF4340 domain-containing protein [Planctomycetota bacterium]
MSRLTLLLLLVLVAGLGYLAWRQSQADATWVKDNDVPLFPGLAVNDVAAVRIDNLERGAQMRFERDAKLGWMMVDPVRVRAESGILDLLVKSAVERRATPIAESEIDTQRLGFEPPRFVLEFITATGERSRIDVGAADLDRNRVYVRIGGKIMRAVRDFETMLDLGAEEYQSHYATTLDARNIAELHRRGTMRFPGSTEEVDVTLDALLDDGQWRSTAPVHALLDPVGMAILAQGGASLQFDHLVPTGGAPLAALGLDPPAFQIEFQEARGESATLLLGPSDPLRPAQWNGTRVGENTVWRIPSDLALALATRIDDLLDHRIHRLGREEMAEIQLSSAHGEVRLQSSRLGWAVSEANPGSKVFGPVRMADSKRVADFLGRLHQLEIRTFIVERSALTPEETQVTLRITTPAGAVSACSFGGAHPSGGVRFQRAGDDVIGVVDEAALELLGRRAQSFWSTTILETAEISVVSLTLSRGPVERVFERDRAGLWVEKGRTSEAKELHPLLDPLLFLRAERHLSSLAPPIAEPLRVRWTLSQAQSVLDFGYVELDGVRTAVCDFEGRRSVLERPDLIDKLGQLLDAVPR